MSHPFEVHQELVYDSENDELYRQETIYDDDLYWLNQREADDYRNEWSDEDLYDEHEACHPDEPCIEDQPDPDRYHDDIGDID